MSSSKNNIVIDKSSIIAYDDSDPRYKFHIKDSTEYSKNIYPLHFSKTCHENRAFDKFVKYDYPLISRCWGERYENCAILEKYNQTLKRNDDIEKPILEAGNCACSECTMNLYGRIGDTLGYARVDLTDDTIQHNMDIDTDLNTDLDTFTDDKEYNILNKNDFKKQYQSSIYDKTRIMNSDGLYVDRSPDVKRCGTSQCTNKKGNGLEYNLEPNSKYAYYEKNNNTKDMVEGFLGGLTTGAKISSWICIICIILSVIASIVGIVKKIAR